MVYTEMAQNKFDEKGGRESVFDIKHSNPKDYLIQECFPDYFETQGNWFAITDQYYNDFVGVKKEELIADLRKELDGLREALVFYLINIEPINREDPNKYVPHDLIREINPKTVVSFNYTDTYQMLYGKSEILHIHGTLSDNNIVLGYDEDVDTVSDLDFVYFIKYFQRIRFMTDVLRHEIINEKVIGGGIVGLRDKDVYFFGHSLDITDREQLELLFGTKGKIIVYYTDETDYETKVVNIIKLLGKEATVERIKEERILFKRIPGSQ